MSMEQILEMVGGLDGVLDLAPVAGSEYPEIAWGDHFFYFAPDGQVPRREQPYATIVTKNYPGDTLSDLDEPGRWRLNIHVGQPACADLLGADEKPDAHRVDLAEVDTVIPHPIYARQGWIAIVNPGARTSAIAMELLRRAHESARRRANRGGTASTVQSVGNDVENDR